MACEIISQPVLYGRIYDEMGKKGKEHSLVAVLL